MKIDLVIEYLISIGQLTGDLSMVSFRQLNDSNGIPNGVYEIASWRFPQPQPSQVELETTALSPQFEAYLFARPTVEQREAAKKSIDEQQKFLVKILIKELNDLRGFNRRFKQEVALATTLADLKVRVAQLPGMADRTFEQLKNQIDNEV